MDTAKHPTVNSTALTTKNYLTQNVNRLKDPDKHRLPLYFENTEED
jgi:hypothetical protein